MKYLSIILFALIAANTSAHHTYNLVLSKSKEVVAKGFTSYSDCSDTKAEMKASYDDSLYCVTAWH
ncbi:MAG: hypothetical protein CL693_13065 [Cellvibrionaceae bacterium]|nr:hypothetical protein [Cellvibrionaceae bacterium]|tara:strand:- start:591 stop:788 length:198 start_codon:yes stop_codon:yes gene_type:complete